MATSLDEVMALGPVQAQVTVHQLLRQAPRRWTLGFLRRGWNQPLPAPPGTRLPLPAPPGTPPGIYHRAVPAGPQPKSGTSQGSSGTTVVDEAKVEETESEDESEDDPPPLEPIIEEEPIIQEEPIDDNTTVAAVSPQAAP